MSIYTTLQAVRNRYPAIVTAEQCVAMLNETAWLHRAEGIGLLRKSGSASSAPQPGTGISCDTDILMSYGPPGQYADVFGAAGAGIATPQPPDWLPAGDIAHEFVAPVDPGGTVPGPDPQPPAGDFATASAALERQVAALTARVAALEAAGPVLPPSIDGATIALQDSSGLFVCSEQGQDDHPLHANRLSQGSWETFTVRVVK